MWLNVDVSMKSNSGVWTSFDSVPTGAFAFRYYTIHDANQPGNILGKLQVAITADTNFEIVPSPNNPKMLMIVPSSP